MSAAPDAPAPGRRLRLNLVVNMASQGLSVLAGLVTAPVYVRLLGREALGLIGVHLTLQALVRLLDLGLTPTVTREVARLEAAGDAAEQARFVATFGRIFAAVAAVVAIGVPLAAPWLATGWLNVAGFSTETVTRAIVLMGLVAAIRWLAVFFEGVMYGLERHSVFHTLRCVELIGAHGCAIALVAGPARRVEVIFACQLAFGLVSVTVAGLLVTRWIRSRATHRGFDLEVLRRTWRVTAGMATLGVTGLLLGNMDKVVLTRTLGLDAFGDYTLAFLGANVLVTTVVIPVFNVIYPRCSALVAEGNEAKLSELYHLAVQGLAAIAFPFTALLALYGERLLFLWSGDATAAASAAQVLPLLALAFSLNAMMVPAYALQLAAAWTTLGIRINTVLLAVFAPLLLVLSDRAGAPGAAAALALMQLSYLAVGLPLTHRRLLRGEGLAVITRDVLPPAAVAAGGAAVFALQAWRPSPLLGELAWIAGVGACLVLAAAVSCGRLRARARDLLAPPAEA